jgi:hypothetical protein
MKLRANFGLAIVLGLGLASGACGDDNPSVQHDAAMPDTAIDAPMQAATLTTFVIDLIQNHSTDPTPAAFDTFSMLPDPDGTSNNTAAYNPLFP